MVEVGEVMYFLVGVPASPPLRAEPWLESPLRTPIGELELAGRLENVAGIDPARMRILRRFTVVLFEEGRGYYADARGRREELGPGSVVVVFPELAHAYGPVGGGAWSQVYFVFAGPQFELWREHGLLTPERPVLRLGAPEYWGQRLEAVVRGESLHRPGSALRAMGRFLQVLAEMTAVDAERAVRPGGDAWLEQSLRLLGDRSAAGWPAPQDVARSAGLSYENFRKRFSQLTGESPGRYQKRRRLEWACAAIYQGGHSLKQIADELGFCDVFHFSKAFKQEIGLAPSEYRRRVLGR
jgi:AraC-like DNA-binding protein